MNKDLQGPPTQLSTAFSNSPTPTTGSDWSYPLSPAGSAPPQNRNFPDTPPESGHTSASTTDGAMQNGMRGPPNGNPSPPSSISRSSDNGQYAHSIAGSVDSRRAYMMEESLSEHYRVLKNYLAPYLQNERSDPRQNRARDKLLRLTSIQFQELSTDVYDELLRREDDRRRGGPGAPGNPTPKYLLPKTNFHFKRNQARQKLSTLPPDRFRQLATDVFFELERRYPRFLDPSDRPASQASSLGPNRGLAPGGFQPPPRTASRGLGPSDAQYRNGPPYDGPPPGVQPGLDTPPSDFSRPLPKTFQSNTIIPEKGMMVEDDDDDDDMPRGLGGLQGGDFQEMRTQIEQLEQKVDDLEGQLREKSSLLEKAQSTSSDRDSTSEKERSQWNDLRSNLEAKVREAQDLNNSLKAELDRVQNEKQANERELQGQLETARRNERDIERDLRNQLDSARREGQDIERDLKTQLANMAGSMTGGAMANRGLDNNVPPIEWRERFETMEQELTTQRQTTEEVRRDAAQFLQEMRSLSQQSSDAMEKEEQLLDQVSALERELREWKSRYAKMKSQNRSLRASTLGLPGINGDAAQFARDSPYCSPNGLIKDFHVTNYQLAIDEFLQLARRPDASEAVTECMKQVIVAVREISSDMEPISSAGNLDGNATDATKERARVKSKLSSAANNFITATKSHTASAGLAPVSLVDAAASHLTAAIVEIIQMAKIHPTPADELDDSDERMIKPAPLIMRNKTPEMGKANGHTNGHIRNQSSMGSSAGYSAYSRYSRYSNNMSPAREISMNGDKGLGISPTMGMVRESGIEEFKNYLEDSTAVLVRSIQPLVNIVRSGGGDDAAITEYIRDIDATVQDIATKTNTAIIELRDAALQKHAPPVIKFLESNGAELVRLNEEGKPRDVLPPVAFKIARATKELVLRVDRIETGELTAETSLPTEF